MQIKSKLELQDTLKNVSKDQIIDLLHNAWCELYRISERVKSVWHMQTYFFKGELLDELLDDVNIKNDDELLKENAKLTKELDLWYSKYQWEVNLTDMLYKELDKLKASKNKALDLLSHFSSCQVCEHTQELASKLEEILKGSDEDE